MNGNTKLNTNKLAKNAKHLIVLDGIYMFLNNHTILELLCL